MKKLAIGIIVALGMGFASCSDELDLVVPYPTNITFDELSIPQRFSHVVPDGGFDASGIHFNTVKDASGQLAGGFCYSNRSLRNFTWTGTQEAIDSMRYSVYTSKPNDTGVYLVANAAGNNAYFTLESPRVIEYLLIANSTWGYLAARYGDTYGTADAPVANPNVPSQPKGVWHTYVPGGVSKLGAGNHITVTAVGYKGSSEVGRKQIYLMCGQGYDEQNPAWNYYVMEWRKFDLASLGEVDKVLFTYDSSDKAEDGTVRTPSWFCIDGIQLKQ